MNSEMDLACQVIEQLLEPCEKCGKVARGARLELTEDSDLALCQECYEDKDSLQLWFEAEIEAALRESDEWERLPDGKWRTKTPKGQLTVTH